MLVDGPQSKDINQIPSFSPPPVGRDVGLVVAWGYMYILECTHMHKVAVLTVSPYKCVHRVNLDYSEISVNPSVLCAHFLILMAHDPQQYSRMQRHENQVKVDSPAVHDASFIRND